MKQTAVEEKVGEGLPDSRWKMVRYGFGDKSEPFQNPVVCRHPKQQERESLNKEDAGADEDQ
jgi:hypothetical protein